MLSVGVINLDCDIRAIIGSERVDECWRSFIDLISAKSMRDERDKIE